MASATLIGLHRTSSNPGRSTEVPRRASRIRRGLAEGRPECVWSIPTSFGRSIDQRRRDNVTPTDTWIEEALSPGLPGRGLGCCLARLVPSDIGRLNVTPGLSIDWCSSLVSNDNIEFKFSPKCWGSYSPSTRNSFRLTSGPMERFLSAHANVGVFATSTSALSVSMSFTSATNLRIVVGETWIKLAVAVIGFVFAQSIRLRPRDMHISVLGKAAMACVPGCQKVA